jgi:hypothetical protein
LSGLKEAGSTKLATPTSGGQKFLSNLSGNTQNLVKNWAKRNQADFHRIPIVGPILKLIHDSAVQAYRQHKKEKKAQLEAAATIGGEETSQAQTAEAATATTPTAKAQGAAAAKATQTMTTPHGNVSVTKIAGQPNAYSSSSPKALMSTLKEDGVKSFTINKGPANQSLACMKEGLNLGIPHVKLSEDQERKVLNELTTDTKNPKLNARNAQALSEYNNMKAINEVNAENNKGKGLKSLSEGNPSLNAQALATLSDPSSGKANPGAAQYLNTQVPSLTNNDRKDALEILSDKHDKGLISDQQFNEAAKPMLEQMDKKDANSRATFRAESSGDNNFAKAEEKYNKLNPSPAPQATAALQQTPSAPPTATTSPSATTAAATNAPATPKLTAGAAATRDVISQPPNKPLPPLQQQASATTAPTANTPATPAPTAGAAATRDVISQPPNKPLPPLQQQPSATPTASASSSATSAPSATAAARSAATVNFNPSKPPSTPLPTLPQRPSPAPANQQATASASKTTQAEPVQSWPKNSMKEVRLAQGVEAKGEALSNKLSSQEVGRLAIGALKASMAGSPGAFVSMVTQALSTPQPKSATEPKNDEDKQNNKQVKQAGNAQKSANMPSLMKNLSNLDLQAVITQLATMAATKISQNKSPSSELNSLKDIQKGLDEEQKSGKSDRPKDKSSRSSAGGYASKAGAPPALSKLIDTLSNKVDDLSKQNKQRKDQNALNKAQGQTSSTPTPSSSTGKTS